MPVYPTCPMKKKALIVDDDESMLNILSAVLEGQGFDVVSVPAAADAIEKVGDNEFDLVVTDVLMPGMVGVRTLLNHLESLPGKIPTIVISAYWDEDREMQAFFEDKADGCLSKPFDLDDFRELLGRVCRR